MITVDRVSVSAPGRLILDSISCTIEAGDFWLVLGANGAGKTTLLKTLAGVGRSYSGSIHWQGRELRHISPRAQAKQSVYLSQEEAFAIPLRVRDILMLGRYPYQGLFSRFSVQDHEVFDSIVARFGLEPFLDRNIQTLSGGEKKKVALASALIQDVPAILLDEPFNSLDPRSVANLLRLIAETSRAQKTIILVSHALDRLFPLATHLLLLKNGHCLYAGRRTFDSELLQETYGVGFRQVRLEQHTRIIADD